MSDSKIKVSEMPRADGLNSQDMLYVTVVDKDELYSKSCTISTLTETISVDVGIENIKVKVNDHATSIGNINNDISAINRVLDSISEQTTANVNDIKTLSGNTTSLTVTVTNHANSISELSTATKQATEDKLGTIKVGYTTKDNNYAVSVDLDGNAYVTVPSSSETDPRIAQLANISSYYVSSDNTPIPLNNYNNIIAMSSYVNYAIEETSSLNDLVDVIAKFGGDAHDDEYILSSGLLYDLSSEVSAAKFMLGSGNAAYDVSDNWISLSADSLVIAVVKNDLSTASKIEYRENSDATPITVAGSQKSEIEIVSNFTVHAKAGVQFKLTGATRNLITIS